MPLPVSFWCPFCVLVLLVLFSLMSDLLTGWFYRTQVLSFIKDLMVVISLRGTVDIGATTALVDIDQTITMMTMARVMSDMKKGFDSLVFSIIFSYSSVLVWSL